jgi:hypothetical protein
MCFVPCLLLIALWVRSYWWSDLLHGHAKQSPIEIISSEGRLKITRVQQVLGFVAPQYSRRGPQGPGFVAQQYAGWLCFADDSSEAQTMASHIRSFPTWSGIGIVPRHHRAVLAPYWLVVVLATGVGVALSRVRWSNRFGMRTLLLTMTFVAVVLGLVMWLIRT